MTSLNGGALLIRNRRMKCLANHSHFNPNITKYVWLRIPLSHNNKAVQLITSKDACQVFKPSEGQVILGNPNFETAILKYWRRYGIANQGHTTITGGLYVLSHALFMCNHINLYGFWPFSSFMNNNQIKYHYFDKGRRGRTHTWNAEFEMLMRLHDARILNLNIFC
ncbi:alpha-N-acetylneuraminide alpha-2,8-sialyltransferase-like [Amphiura filiformis]|uniref:alpha-N-acetylneuraminide alpha-2,8-sialyltransferase-like n=1 Tax=Amphiura filiformis TaxID=82378 RepID=UPI003B20C464